MKNITPKIEELLAEIKSDSSPAASKVRAKLEAAIRILEADAAVAVQSKAE